MDSERLEASRKTLTGDTAPSEATPPSSSIERPENANIYLHDVARAIADKSPDAETLLEKWRLKFHRVYYERWSTAAPAAIAEITPRRPPFDYRLQEPTRRVRSRRARVESATQRAENGAQADEVSRRNQTEGLSEPAWTYWREALVCYPACEKYADLNDVVRDLADLYLRATNYTDAEDAAFCHRLLRDAMGDCISYYEDWADPATDDAEKRARLNRMRHLRRRLAEVSALYRRCAERRTVTQYTFGMLLGLLAVPIFFLVNAGAFWLIERIQPIELHQSLRAGVHIGCALGGIGATSSVLLRISSSSVNIDVESTRHGWYFWDNPVVQRGVARVVIGTLFGGMAAWFLLAGGLLPDTFQPDADDAASTLLAIGVVAYISGFSERFIPDLIVRSTRSDTHAQPRGPEASSVPPST